MWFGELVLLACCGSYYGFKDLKCTCTLTAHALSDAINAMRLRVAHAFSWARPPRLLLLGVSAIHVLWLFVVLGTHPSRRLSQACPFSYISHRSTICSHDHDQSHLWVSYENSFSTKPFPDNYFILDKSWEREAPVNG